VGKNAETGLERPANASRFYRALYGKRDRFAVLLSETSLASSFGAAAQKRFAFLPRAVRKRDRFAVLLSETSLAGSLGAAMQKRYAFLITHGRA
jgi:uncharacterized membrane protein (DUF485 family)